MKYPERMTLDALLAKVDPSLHAVLESRVAQFAATHLVLFRNNTFDSSEFGAQTVVLVGGACKYHSVEEVSGRPLYDLPSRRQYAIAYAPVAN